MVEGDKRSDDEKKDGSDDEDSNSDSSDSSVEMKRKKKVSDEILRARERSFKINACQCFEGGRSRKNL